MASIDINWAGVGVTLTEPETKQLETAEDVTTAVMGCSPLRVS